MLRYRLAIAVAERDEIAYPQVPQAPSWTSGMDWGRWSERDTSTPTSTGTPPVTTARGLGKP